MGLCVFISCLDDKIIHKEWGGIIPGIGEEVVFTHGGAIVPQSDEGEVVHKIVRERWYVDRVQLEDGESKDGLAAVFYIYVRVPENESFVTDEHRKEVEEEIQVQANAALRAVQPHLWN